MSKKYVPNLTGLMAVLLPAQLQPANRLSGNCSIREAVDNVISGKLTCGLRI